MRETKQGLNNQRELRIGSTTKIEYYCGEAWILIAITHQGGGKKRI